MGEGLDEGVVTKGLGSVISTAIGALIGVATGGSTGLFGTALGHVLAIAGAACGLWFSLVFGRYFGVLAASAPTADADERAGYVELRQSLAEGGAVARLYADRLRRFLVRIERFLGDAGMADRSLLSRALGLRQAKPLWTASALDRCLLLALLYPIVSIFLIWSISGQVGQAESALSLPQHWPAWGRILALAASCFAAFAVWRNAQTTNPQHGIRQWLPFAIFTLAVLSATGSVACGIMFACAVIMSASASASIFNSEEAESSSDDGALFNTDAGTVTTIISDTIFLCVSISIVACIAAAFNFHSICFVVIFAGFGIASFCAICFAFALRDVIFRSGVVAVVCTVSITVILAVATASAGAVKEAVADAGAGAGAGAVAAAVTFCVASLGISFVQGSGTIFIGFPFARIITIMTNNCSKELWISVFMVSIVAVFFAAAYVFALISPGWVLPILLFIGLLTVINAPFDWLSLGLTRALLWRGLELGGWWPLVLAIVDAAAAAVIVALLTIAMVLGVQAFDSLAVLGGGTAALPLEPIFAGIGNRATALEPEYWWVYALLLSTMIPSLINLGIGGASLMRGLPGMPSLLLRKLPADKAVRSYDRTWIAMVLALQTVGGVILGVVVQALIFWAVIAYAMPWCGLNLLDLARGLAALNLPDRAWHLLGFAP